MLGWERKKTALNTITHLKTSGDFQATGQFCFISVFLLVIEINFSVTYAELEEFTHRFKPSLISRELLSEWCPSPAIPFYFIEIPFQKITAILNTF